MTAELNNKIIVLNGFGIRERRIEAAAIAWMSWQFPSRSWESASPEIKKRFRDGAEMVVSALDEITGRS